MPAVGSLQLQIEPLDASVYVDGYFKGSVADLRQPGVPLPAGSHRVEVRAAGFQSRTFDIRITDGETVTYRQMLDREVPPPSPPVARAVPKTLYVIPNCYAGDRPPAAGINCDRTKLRTIR